MNKSIILRLLFAGLVLVAASRCQRSIVIAPTATNVNSLTFKDTSHIVPYPQNGRQNCSILPVYGDSILYQQPTAPGQDYMANLVNNPGTGRYYSWPEGLVLDSISGAIDISKSEIGARYDIGFVQSGTTDTCLQQVTIGGYSYIDSIYTLDGSDTIASPYFEANPYLASICASGNGCRFDIGGKAAAKGLKIDPQTGSIDIKKTKKIFGNKPTNGLIVPVTIVYSLNDNSQNALQQLTIDLVYYDLKTNIPANVLNLIEARRNSILQNLPIILAGSLAVRPPLIIITR